MLQKRGEVTRISVVREGEIKPETDEKKEESK